MGIVQEFERFLKRTEPGPGKDQADDGVPGETHLKLKSIPNVSTARLLRRRAFISPFTAGETPPDGDDSRAKMRDHGMHKLCIDHELTLRGMP